MDWISYDIQKIDRLGTFPFRVKMLYFSRRHTVGNRHGYTPEDMFEISIRFEPQETICTDIINGQAIRETFPNMVWKKPGGKHYFQIDHPRDAISFGYPAESEDDFRKLGLYSDRESMSFSVTPKIEQLAGEFRKLSLQLYTPGVADQIDWICFQLYREIFYSDLLKSGGQDDAEKIRNISVWFQVHYSETIDLEKIARINGYSRSAFFRNWKRFFQTTPTQFLLDLKLDAATRFLINTNLPINEIVREINFSGSTAFHKRFYQRYGMTPKEYRQFHSADKQPEYSQ